MFKERGVNLGAIRDGEHGKNTLYGITKELI